MTTLKPDTGGTAEKVIRIGGGPTISLREASFVRFPGAGEPGSPHFGESDCNSPAHWDGDTFYLFNSAAHPTRGSGTDLFHLDDAHRSVEFDRETRGGRWIESTWKAEDSTLYGWYHNEPSGLLPEHEPARHLTAPRIGAARSKDNGATWEDLGIVLEAPSDSMRRDTTNFYFAGGNGDFSVIPDERREYLYFLFSTYHREVGEQGVSIARMRYADRDRPVGKVWKWHAGRWSEPGIGGKVTPFLPVTGDWHSQDVDAFWGPSIHWNTHLKQYVILLNRAIDPNWRQEGIYISFNRDLADPSGWTRPHKLLDRQEIATALQAPSGWYPQVIGLDTERRETDKLAGRAARLFVHGSSKWEIVFSQSAEAP